MGRINKINYYDLIEIEQNINHPFSRHIITGKAKKEIAKGDFVWHDLGNGIATSISKYKLRKDSIISLSSNIPGAVLIFNLGDDFTHIFKDKKKYLIKKNSFFIGLSSDNFTVKMEQKKDLNYSTLTIGIKEELFIKFADILKNAYTKIDEAKQNSYALLEGGKIDPIQNDIIKLLQDKTIDKNLLDAIYLETKCTNLLHYTIEKIVESISKIENLNFNINRINSLEKAKNIILKEYHKPISIKEIAYKSAINECYLKKDFKAYYDMTIHDMIKNQRMEKAKELLQQDFEVKEVASQVGYKQVGYFSTLFLNYFGKTPSNYKKQFKS